LEHYLIMSITINGSGTVTGISVGGIPDGVVDTDVLAANAVTFGKIGTTEQGQLCKAWVNFNGTGAVAIRASYNVSSITDSGVGIYVVNFATALTDANYAYSRETDGNWYGGETSAATASALAIYFTNAAANAYVDQTYVRIAAFR
jgi:hypothetical protein